MSENMMYQAGRKKWFLEIELGKANKMPYMVETGQVPGFRLAYIFNGDPDHSIEMKTIQSLNILGISKENDGPEGYIYH